MKRKIFSITSISFGIASLVIYNYCSIDTLFYVGLVLISVGIYNLKHK